MEPLADLEAVAHPRETNLIVSLIDTILGEQNYDKIFFEVSFVILVDHFLFIFLSNSRTFN